MKSTASSSPGCRAGGRCMARLPSTPFPACGPPSCDSGSASAPPTPGCASSASSSPSRLLSRSGSTPGGRLPPFSRWPSRPSIAVFYYGSSLRAYGLALLLVILLFGAVWRVIDRPRPFRIVAAVLLSILCANANYQDSYLIFAVCTAGAVVCLAQRLWGRGALILGIGLAGALSLLPYVGIIRAYAVGGSIRQASPGVGAVWEQFCEAFDPARWALLPLFLLLVLLARRGDRKST